MSLTCPCPAQHRYLADCPVAIRDGLVPDRPTEPPPAPGTPGGLGWVDRRPALITDEVEALTALRDLIADDLEEFAWALHRDATAHAEVTGESFEQSARFLLEVRRG